MRRFGKYCLLLMISVLAALGIQRTIHVQAEESVKEDGIYYYNGLRWNTSPHYVEYSGGETFTSIYWICGTDLGAKVTTTDVAPENYPESCVAYCCDYATHIENAAPNNGYRRMNLEDSTYFDAEAAKKIRSVLQNGYWKGWTSAELIAAEQNANAWLATTTETRRISNLTGAEALAATQGAIWSVSNGYTITYAKTDGNFAKDDRVDGHTFDTASAQVNESSTENTENNINLFIQYLLSQEPKVPEKIVFTDKYFTENQTGFISGSEDDQNVVLYFKLSGQIGAGDDLKLYAKLGDRDVEGYPLTGEGALETDENGYYKLEFSNVTVQEAEKGVALKILGTQEVDGVYFYQAIANGEKNERETTQNLVGKYKGSTDISASATFKIGTVTDQKLYVSLYKQDGDDEEVLLEGVEFDLYAMDAEGDGQIWLVKSGLVTDENGYICVNGLPDGYQYYFKEVEPLEGYIVNEDYIEASAWIEGEENAVYVKNYQIPPEDPEEPEEPEDPEDPETPETPTTPTEKPKEPTKTVVKTTKVVPKTGDEEPLMAWGLTLAGSGLFICAAGVYILYRKKRSEI